MTKITFLSLVNDLDDEQARSLAADCAENVVHIVEAVYPKSGHVLNCIEVTRQFARGRATRKQLNAARNTAQKINQIDRETSGNPHTNHGKPPLAAEKAILAAVRAGAGHPKGAAIGASHAATEAVLINANSIFDIISSFVMVASFMLPRYPIGFFYTVETKPWRAVFFIAIYINFDYFEFI